MKGEIASRRDEKQHVDERRNSQQNIGETASRPEEKQQVDEMRNSNQMREETASRREEGKIDERNRTSIVTIKHGHELDSPLFASKHSYSQ